jgi:hypothetical protein
MAAFCSAQAGDNAVASRAELMAVMLPTVLTVFGKHNDNVS